MTPEIKRLIDYMEAGAKAATPGRWESTGVVVAVPVDGGMDYLVEQFSGTDSPNLEHIATTCPDNILVLIEAFRKADKAAKALATFVGQLQEMDIENPGAPMGGADTVQFICEQYPTLKAALP